MRADRELSASRGLYSHCPLKKRPVLFCQDPDEPKDIATDKEPLEPENLSTKPEDLRLIGRTQSAPSAVAPIFLKRCPVEDRTESRTPSKTPYQNVHNSIQYSHQQDQIFINSNTTSKDISLESFESNKTVDLDRKTFPPSWHHIAPHCLPYLYPYPYAEEVYSKYYTTGVPFDQPITYPSRDGSPTHVVRTHVPYLSKPYEPHRTTDICSLSPTSTTSSSSRYYFLGTPTPPRTPEDLLSPRSVSSSEGSSTGSTGYGKRVVESSPTHRYQCSFCTKSYSTYSGLSKHQQFHCAANKDSTSKKTFSCKSCEKVYVSLGALKMHIRTHTLPCKCVICGKCFSRPWLLQGHIRTHTGEKPFSCPLCERAFADRSNLRAHLQTHSEVKKYCCSSCGKSFSRMSLLTKHLGGGCPGPGHSSEDVST